MLDPALKLEISSINASLPLKGSGVGILAMGPKFPLTDAIAAFPIGIALIGGLRVGVAEREGACNEGASSSVIAATVTEDSRK